MFFKKRFNFFSSNSELPLNLISFTFTLEPLLTSMYKITLFVSEVSGIWIILTSVFKKPLSIKYSSVLFFAFTSKFSLTILFLLKSSYSLNCSVSDFFVNLKVNLDN